MTLALKYRPTQFRDLVGQHSVSQTLSLALDQKKISNAYLFSGLRGSGKTSSARIFARALQCDDGPTSLPCGVCANCKASLEGRHIDIIELDAASNRKIDDIRDLIEQTKYKPGFGRYKIFIIDEVHMLTKEAFNALLKTLEEPPEFVKFILATTDPLLMPATILSRTQHFRFKKIPYRSVLEHLIFILQKENVSFEEEALNIIARSGSGSLRDTLTLLEQAIIFGNNKVELASVTEMLGIIDPLILDEFFQAIVQKDFQKTEEILALMQEYECDMVIDEMILFLKERALSKRFDPVLFNRFFNILAQSKSLLSLNSDGEFVLLLSLLKMQEATKLQDVRGLITTLEKTSLPEVQRFAQDDQNSLQEESKISPLAQENLQSGPEKSLFKNLIQALYDRNCDLGECFEKNIRELGFENGSLLLESFANDESDKILLREHYPLIKSFILQVYGQETQIKFQTASTQKAQVLPSQEALEVTQAVQPVQAGQQESTDQERVSTPLSKVEKEMLDPQDFAQDFTQDLPSSQDLSPESLEQSINQDKQAVENPSSQAPSFALRNQTLLSHLKKHLQVDLSTAKRI